MNVCPDCQGKGATAPNGVQYCNCPDMAPWVAERDALRHVIHELLMERAALRKALERATVTVTGSRDG